MRIDVVTLFPEMFGVVRDLGVTGRAHAQGRWSLHAWNPRDFTHDVHRTVDDRPYGGGPGMVMMAARWRRLSAPPSRRGLPRGWGLRRSPCWRRWGAAMTRPEPRPWPRATG